MPTPSPRTASVHRTTNETDVQVEIGLDGTGSYSNDTGVGFLDHMLDLFAKHGGFDLEVSCDGDLHIDEHHTVEDVGITLGMAIREALGDKKRITRYGHAYVPMDETLSRAVIDLSGRFYLHVDADFSRSMVGDLSTEMVSHFWYSVAEHVRCNLHVTVLYGTNDHHKIEAMFKSVARALRTAVQRSDENPEVASTKGTI
ncbi:imidazoleglycerol-phosphate dehydratase [Longibacter salinarum]|uniref:Imidazoleglycerol-phosphate dehydratase n=1 Tax=Longibacter salinarum TaxID=1850348 RepID=A0A2A8D2M9_9BACT|nr:imidazoleglycerol-phosphate dehydratase HisB [Longibacter salinarum]PEN15222.1 imidazoleglycerol-phosphate dehydratase [Longibacter salinarum]